MPKLNKEPKTSISREVEVTMLTNNLPPNVLPPLPGSRPASKLDQGKDTFDLLPLSKSVAYTAVYEDAVEQLAVLGDIAPAMGKLEGKPQIGEDIARLIKEQKSLETRHQELLENQEQYKASNDPISLKQCESAIFEIQRELQICSQALSRSMKAHPSSSENLLKIQNERTIVHTLLVRAQSDIKDGKFDVLVNTVQEEHKKKHTLENTINKQSEASELLRELQRELANEERLLEEELNDRNQVIQQLKDTIQEINALTTSEQKYIKKETKAHENSVKQRCQSKESALIETRGILIKKLELEKRCNLKTVDYLTRQREIMEKQIQDWMAMYEEDTEAKTLELETLKQKRSQDLDRFEELVAAYEELEKVVEEDRVAREREAEEHRIQENRLRACTRIQRWWRKKLEAKKNAAAKSAKKGGKGKGKKEKKGKK